MERISKDTPNKGMGINLDQALRIWQEEGLPDKIIRYLQDRIVLDFDPQKGQIVYKQNTELGEESSTQLITRSLSASSRMVGHRELAIIYGWEKITACSPDLQVPTSPIVHNFWVGIHPRIDWWLYTILINRLTQLDTAHMENLYD